MDNREVPVEEALPNDQLVGRPDESNIIINQSGIAYMMEVIPSYKPG